MHDVPCGVQQPTESDERPRLQSAVGDVGQHRSERELPRPPPLRYAAPAPATMIALNRRRYGSRINELTQTYRTSTSNGRTTVMT
jgi:hypothetical protein